MEFSGVLVLGLKISEGCNIILWSLWKWSLILSAISRGKVNNVKIPGSFSKSISSPLPLCLFSGRAHCNTSSLGRSIPVWEVKPLLFSYNPKILGVNMLLNTGKILSLIAFYKLFLSDIKIKVLINSWHFFNGFFYVSSATSRLTPSVFSKWKVLRWDTYWENFSDISDLYSRVLKFQMFSYQ